MQTSITGRHVDISEPLKAYVDTKFERLQRRFDSFTKTHVVLSVEKLAHKAEASFFLGGIQIFAEASEKDMYAAIDSLVDKLDRQIKRQKEKLTDHHQEGGGIKKLEI